MPMKQTPVDNISAAIREEIGRLADEQVLGARPATILPLLQKRGIDLTPSVQSMTSRQLSAAKRRCRRAALSVPKTDATPGDQIVAAHTLVKACGGFKAAKTLLEILEDAARIRSTED
jgi:hypothetical protein